MANTENTRTEEEWLRSINVGAPRFKPGAQGGKYAGMPFKEGAKHMESIRKAPSMQKSNETQGDRNRGGPSKSAASRASEALAVLQAAQAKSQEGLGQLNVGNTIKTDTSKVSLGSDEPRSYEKGAVAASGTNLDYEKEKKRLGLA